MTRTSGALLAVLALTFGGCGPGPVESADGGTRADAAPIDGAPIDAFAIDGAPIDAFAIDGEVIDGGPSGPPLAVFDPAPPEYWYVDALPFTVGVTGANVAYYRFRLDGEEFGDPIPVGTPISIDYVRPGLRTIELEGQNAAGEWQATPTTASFHMITLVHEAIACDAASCDLLVPTGATAAYYHPPGGDILSWEVAADIGPGDTICLAGGTHGRRGFRGFSGSAEAPVRIVNCGGVARGAYTSGAGGAAILLDGFEHVALVGIGSTSAELGIDLSASAPGAHGVGIEGGTTHVEVAFIDIHDTENHGIDAKSDSSTAAQCTYGRDRFVQEDTFLHHNHIADIRYEAIYAGSSHYERVNEDVNCAGEIRDVREHLLDGVRVHDNLVEHIGNDGIQIGNALHHVAVYRNRVFDCGLGRDLGHSSGIQIGSGSRAWVEGNLVRGAGIGVVVGGTGDTTVINNVLQDISGGAITLHLTMPGLLEPDTGYHFVNNTIIDSGTCEAWDTMGRTMCWCGDGRALCTYDTIGVGNVFINNLIEGTPMPPPFSGTEMDANVVADMQCVDPDDGDYNLRDGSTAIDSGRDASEWGVTRDFTGAPRTGAYDVGAMER